MSTRLPAPAFESKITTMEELKAILIPSKYIGRCVEQVEIFLANEVDPLLKDGNYAMKIELSV